MQVRATETGEASQPRHRRPAPAGARGRRGWLPGRRALWPAPESTRGDRCDERGHGRFRIAGDGQIGVSVTVEPPAWQFDFTSRLSAPIWITLRPARRFSIRFGRPIRSCTSFVRPHSSTGPKREEDVSLGESACSRRPVGGLYGWRLGKFIRAPPSMTGGVEKRSASSVRSCGARSNVRSVSVDDGLPRRPAALRRRAPPHRHPADATAGAASNCAMWLLRDFSNGSSCTSVSIVTSTGAVGPSSPDRMPEPTLRRWPCSDVGCASHFVKSRTSAFWSSAAWFHSTFGSARRRVLHVSGDHQNRRAIGIGVVDRHARVLQADRSMHHAGHRFARDLRIAMRHGDRTFFMQAKDEFGFAIHPVIQERFL